MQANPRRTSNSPGALDRVERRQQADEEIERIAAGVRSLRILQQRFLNGDLKTPPTEETQRLQQDMRRLRESFRDARSRFRLDSLQGQLQANASLFGRRLDARERGEGPQSTVPEPLDAARGVILGGGDDAGAEQALYRHLTRDPRAAERLDAHRFHTMLQTHVATIRAKTGCQEIHFRVELEDGKPKLKARPIKAPS